MLKRHSKLATWLLEHNATQSAAYVADEPHRLAYRKDHPTEVIAAKCMDGRVHLPVYTETPLGSVYPFRNLGGFLNPAWPHYGSLLARHVTATNREGRPCLIAQTYHWSRSVPSLGCKGFGYDVAGARCYTRKMKAKLDRIFTNREKVYPIQLGLETDVEAIVVHNDGDEVLDLSKESGYTDEDFRHHLLRMFPNMPEQVRNDLSFLLMGNQRHVAAVRKENRTTKQQDHCERMLGYGRGFDWLHTPNLAFIVGPYDLDFTTPIAKAIGLLDENRKSCRIDVDDGLVLMTSAIYHDDANDDGVDENLARVRTVSAYKTVKKVIESEPYRHMLDLFVPLVGIMNRRTRKFTLVDF
jgi:hypothetical protein